MSAPRFPNVWCSQCGQGFGPGDHGFSHCANHGGTPPGLAMADAMGDRPDPKHPMFRNHNCARCGSGDRPCRQGNPSQCEFPHARND